jgi:hypothetical protein
MGSLFLPRQCDFSALRFCWIVFAGYVRYPPCGPDSGGTAHAAPPPVILSEAKDRGLIRTQQETVPKFSARLGDWFSALWSRLKRNEERD